MMIECACGCGELIPEFDKKGRKREYINGHYWNGKNKKISDETRKKISESMKGKKHPLYGKLMSDETKLKISKSKKGKKASKEHRKKLSESHKGEKNHNYGKPLSEKTKQKLSDGQKGEKGSNWQGGISFGKYCHHFNDAYKEKIRNYYGRKCFLCDKPESENGIKLSVHHADYNKDCMCDDSMCKCVPLCNSCHGKTSNGDREYWEAKIISKLNPYFTLSDVFGMIPLTNFLK